MPVIRASEISVFRGSQQIVAKGVETHYSSYGASPPKGFKVTVGGNLGAEVGLFFDVYRVGQEQYLLINGHPDAMKKIGRADDDKKFHLCKKFAS